MPSERETREELDREDARFVERLRSVYAPEPLDAARRAAFDAGLRERLERRRWRGRMFVPAFGTAALAALLVWNALPTAQPDAGSAVARVSPAGSRWEQSLFYGDLTRVQSRGQSEELPPEYEAIEIAFFDDV